MACHLLVLGLILDFVTEGKTPSRRHLLYTAKKASAFMLITALSATFCSRRLRRICLPTCLPESFLGYQRGLDLVSTLDYYARRSVSLGNRVSTTLPKRFAQVGGAVLGPFNRTIHILYGLRHGLYWFEVFASCTSLH